MTVHKVQGIDAGGYASYLDASSSVARRGDYYLGNACAVEGPGRWHGKGAEALALRGDVDRARLLAVWEGRDPGSGEIAVRRSATGEHVAAVDCTFSAPKSVSVVWATSGPSVRMQIEHAQSAAVETAIDHIQAVAPLTRQRVDGTITHLPSDGLIAARFRHQTARASAAQQAAGTAPDPQLHDHVAVANMALRADSFAGSAWQWGAIDSRELYRIAAEAGAVYRAELAHQLQQLGFSVHREGRYFELDGVTETARRTFSARTAEVEAARQEFTERYGRSPTALESKNLTLRSRCAKGAAPVDAFSEWRTTAQESGFSPPTPDRMWPRDMRNPSIEEAVHAITTELTSPASERYLTRHEAAFDTRQLRVAVAEAAQGRASGAQIPELIAAVQRQPELIQLDAEHWTTRAMLDAEQEVRSTAQRLAARPVGSTDPSVIAGAIGTARVSLSEEQEAAVTRLCAARGLHLLTAPAGAGKGEVLRATAEVHQAQGHRVHAIAAAGETAQRLQAQIGADTSCTVDSLIWRVEHHHLALTEQDVVMVDEAALLETSRWRDLLRSTGDATVIAAGDPEQLPAIEAGGIWRVLEREVPTERLTENFRAREAWSREAWSALREGSGAEALQAFEERGRISLAPSRAEAREVALDLWDRERVSLASSGRGTSDLILLSDNSNVEVDCLNKGAQQRLLRSGALKGPFVEVTSRHTPAVRRERMHAGDRVVLHRNLRDAHGAVRARNGATGRVETTDPTAKRLHVTLDGGGHIAVAGEDLSAVRLGYARHVYTAQGRTVDRAIVLTGGWQTGRESSYVGVSRAREASYIVSDYSSLEVSDGDRAGALERLGARMSTPRQKVAASEFLQREEPAPREASPPEPRSDPRGRSDPVDAETAKARYGSLVASMRSDLGGSGDLDTAMIRVIERDGAGRDEGR